MIKGWSVGRAGWWQNHVEQDMKVHTIGYVTKLNPGQTPGNPSRARTTAVNDRIRKGKPRFSNLGPGCFCTITGLLLTCTPNEWKSDIIELRYYQSKDENFGFFATRTHTGAFSFHLVSLSSYIISSPSVNYQTPLSHAGTTKLCPFLIGRERGGVGDDVRHVMFLIYLYSPQSEKHTVTRERFIH